MLEWIRWMLVLGCAFAMLSGAIGREEPAGDATGQKRGGRGGEERVPQIAAICTAYQPFLHADVIVSKFILDFPTDEGVLEPKVEIASLYVDRGPEDDLGHQLAEREGIPVYESIEEALTLGGEKLAVDGVLLIGEHGKYPKNRYGQVMYPRMLMMKKILRVFEWSGRVVPVYNDKHLSYNWLDAKWMYDRGRELGVPMMGGSVIPLTWRRPAEFEQPLGSEVKEAVVLAYGGLSRYGFHGLELLQSLLERRKGGETGVRRVECVRGEDFDRAAESGRIPMDLVNAALIEHAGFSLEERPIRENCRNRLAIMIDYRDGTRGHALLLNGYYGSRWFYAARTEGQVRTCEFGYRPHNQKGFVQPVPAFSYLGLNIQQMFLTGRPQYPVERTLLTTGVTAMAVRSVHEGRPIDTTFLDVSYEPPENRPIRPKGEHPTGASTEPWPVEENLRPLFEWRGEP